MPLPDGVLPLPTSPKGEEREPLSIGARLLIWKHRASLPGGKRENDFVFILNNFTFDSPNYK